MAVAVCQVSARPILRLRWRRLLTDDLPDTVRPMPETNTPRTGQVEVYFDGACPVCSREIGFYRGRPGAEAFRFVDASAADAALGPDLTREDALARMHVRRADGSLATGAAAFAEMWRHMPGLRWLGQLLAVPPFGAVAELGYRGFLRVRRLWR